MRTVRAMIGLAATLALLVLPPLVLVGVGWPLAGADMSGEYVRASLRGLALPPALLATAVVASVWGMWGVFTLLILLDTAALVRGRAAHLTPLRLLVLTSLGATVATPSAAFAATASPAHHAPAESTNQEEPRISPVEAEHAEAQPVRRTRILSGFATDSADLTPLMRESLTSTTDLLAAYTEPGTTIAVTGHTDESGPAEHNQDLSQRRADAAAAYLRERLGETVQITVIGHGSKVERGDGDDYGPSGERRVEITYALAPPPQPPPAEPEASASTLDASEEDRHEAPDSDADGAESRVAVQLPANGVLTAAAATGLAAGFGLGRLLRPSQSTRKRPSTATDPASDDKDPLPHDAEPEPLAVSAPHETPLISDDGGLWLATTDSGEPVRVDSLSGLALTGAHADAIAAALLTFAAIDPAIHAITTTDLLDQVGLPPDHPLPGAVVCPGIQQALIRAEAHTLATARANTDDDQPGEKRDEWALLLVSAPTGPASERAAALARATRDARVLVVAAGEWPHGRHVTVERPDELRVRTADGLQCLTGLTVRTRTLDQLITLFPAESAPESGVPAASGKTADTHLGPAPGTDSPTSEERASSTPPDKPAPELTRSGAVRSTVRLRLFAPRLGIEAAGTEITTGLRTTSRTLLTLLTMHRDGVSSDEITEAIAPEANTAHAKGQRNSAVGNLRALLRGATERPDVPVVIHTAGRYRIDADLFSSDVWDFDDALVAARATRDDERLAHLRAAVESYSGPLLAESSEPWLEPERQHRRRAAADACVELARTPDTAQALDWLEKARQIDEFNEPLYRQIMRTQAEYGHPDAVRRTFDILTERLASLDATPAEATTRLLSELTAAPSLVKKPMKPKPARPKNRS